jgi:hypothetical protein
MSQCWRATLQKLLAEFDSLASCGKVAQLVEQFAFNELVAGSNPALPTQKNIKKTR